MPVNEEIVINSRNISTTYFHDVWRYRELLLILVWRDVNVRYKQTVVGLGWTFIRPLLTMLALTIVFHKMVRLSAPGQTAYPLLVLAAMLPWQFFAAALSESGNSLVANANLISKVYFPRIIVPIASVLTSFVDFLITLALMAMVMLFYGYLPDWRISLLFVYMILASAFAFGTGIWFCALNAKYRDIRYVIPFIVQFGLYVSPVGFSSSIVSPRWRTLYSWNPMVGIIDGFRWSLLRGEPVYWPGLLTSIGVTVLLCATGVRYFRKIEQTLADVI